MWWIKKQNKPAPAPAPAKQKFQIRHCEGWQNNIDRLQKLIIDIGDVPDGDKDQQMRIQVHLRGKLKKAIDNYHKYLNDCQ